MPSAALRLALSNNIAPAYDTTHDAQLQQQQQPLQLQPFQLQPSSILQTQFHPASLSVSASVLNTAQPQASAAASVQQHQK